MRFVKSRGSDVHETRLCS